MWIRYCHRDSDDECNWCSCEKAERATRHWHAKPKCVCMCASRKVRARLIGDEKCKWCAQCVLWIDKSQRTNFERRSCIHRTYSQASSAFALLISHWDSLLLKYRFESKPIFFFSFVSFRTCKWDWQRHIRNGAKKMSAFFLTNNFLQSLEQQEATAWEMCIWCTSHVSIVFPIRPAINFVGYRNARQQWNDQRNAFAWLITDERTHRTIVMPVTIFDCERRD